MDIGDTAKGIGRFINHYGKTIPSMPVQFAGKAIGKASEGLREMEDAKEGFNYAAVARSVGFPMGFAGGYMEEHPLRTLGAGSAVYLANKFLGNPVGGVTDAVTFGLTNFRPDENRGETFGDQGSVPYSVPYQQGTPYDTPQGRATTLDEKQIAYEMKRLAKINAVNNITMAGLSDVQRQQGQAYR
jgi:hypothetical protein